MAEKTKSWRFDFAGRHGTAWGAFNLCFTVVTTTTVERVFLDAPWWVAAATTSLGFMATLGYAAFRGRNVPPATVIYQLLCWTGGGGWSAWMLMREPWTFKFWGLGVILLASGAIAAGILAALGSEDKPVELEVSSKPEPELMETGEPGELTREQRNKIGAMILEKINRLGGKPDGEDVPDLVEIDNVGAWKTGGGFTVMGSFASGKWGMDSFKRIVHAIAQELDLPAGCGVELVPISRRTWRMNVTTKNVLAEGARYPADTAGPYTINGPIPIGVKSDGSEMCVELRQRNMAVYGITGGGKTNAMKAVISSIILAGDAMPVGLDMTGSDLINQFMHAPDSGQCEHAPFGAVATNAEEGAGLMRAVIRVGYARKEAYGDLMREHDTTLIPVGAIVRNAAGEERLVPQIEVIADETTRFLRSISPDFPELGKLFTIIMQELRGSGVRVVFPPIGGDNQYVSQAIQKITHTVACLPMESDAEYRHALGAKYAVDPADLAGPGYAFMRQTPSASLELFRFFGEMKPSDIDKVVIRANKLGTICDLDYISEMAANGLKPDGSKWPPGDEMHPSDLGWWDRRWSGWKPTASPAPAKSQPTVAPSPAVQPQGTTMTMEDILQRVADVDQAVEARKAEVTRRAAEQAAADVADLEKAVEQNWSTLPDWLPEIPGPPTWQDTVMEAIRAAGRDGARAKDVIAAAGVDRSTVYAFLKPKLDAREIHQPKPGFYAEIPDS